MTLKIFFSYFCTRASKSRFRSASSGWDAFITRSDPSRAGARADACADSFAGFLRRLSAENGRRGGISPVALRGVRSREWRGRTNRRFPIVPPAASPLSSPRHGAASGRCYCAERLRLRVLDTASGRLLQAQSTDCHKFCDGPARRGAGKARKFRFRRYHYSK